MIEVGSNSCGFEGTKEVGGGDSDGGSDGGNSDGASVGGIIGVKANPGGGGGGCDTS